MDRICALCRKVGTKLFLKGEKCYTPKCPFTRRSYAPGKKGQTRTFSKPKFRKTEYGLQLIEKQKLRFTYGISETQMKNYFKKASRSKEATGEKFLQLLESRLDNVIYRLGFAKSRSQARQLVGHGKAKVNGKKVDIPSFQVKPEEKIETISEVPKESQANVPSWLKRSVTQRDKGKPTGQVLHLPKREEITEEINEQMVVEFYSRH